MVACFPIGLGSRASVLPVEGLDRSASPRSLRISMSLEDAGTEVEQAIDLAREGFYLDLHVAQTRGQSDQSVAAGQEINIGGTTISGPVVVTDEITHSDWSLRARKVIPLQSGFGGELLGGVAFSSYEMMLSTPSQIARDHVRTFGFVAGAALTQTPWPRLQLRAVVELEIGVTEDWREAGKRALELGAMVALHKHVTLAGGWRESRVEANRAATFGSGNSDLKSTLSGPWLGLWLQF